MKNRILALLRWSERYTKTDMVYLFASGFWMNLNFFIVSGLSLLLSVAFANLLPPATYGMYQYLLSLSALASALMMSGMESAVIQAVARGYEGALRSSVRVQLRWAVVPGLLGLTGAVYYFVHGNIEVGIGLVCIAILTPLVSTFSTYSAFLNGKQEFRRAFYYGSIVTAAYYASIFLALFFLKSAPVLLLVNLGANTLALGFVYWKTLKRYRPNDSVDPTTIPYGKHLSVLTAFGLVLTQLDSLFVFHFLGPVKLAVYSFASLIPERAGSLFNFVGAAALPKFANQSIVEIRKNIVAKTLRVGAVALLAALVYSLLAPLLFRLVFPQYLSAIAYTQIYAGIIALLAMINMVNTTLIAQQMKRELYIVGVMNSVLLVCLQIPLLLTHGILGMLVARMIADSVAILLTLYLILRSGSQAAKASA